MNENEKDYHVENKCFMIYKDWESLVDALDSSEQAGELFKALFAFAKRGEEKEFNGALKMAFLVMSHQIAADGEKWERTCAKRQENIKKRWEKNNNTNVYNCIQKDTNDTDKDKDKEEDKDKDKDKEEDKDKDKDKEKDKEKENNARPRFCPPTYEQVKAYCDERKNGVDPQRFVDYYTSIGWTVGKNAMKDWKAAVRSWERRDGKAKTNKTYTDILDLIGKENENA